MIIIEIYKRFELKLNEEKRKKNIFFFKDFEEYTLKLLKNRVRTFAKDINTKYIDPPHTTDFAIMFLPIEGLYAELVRMGMIEELQNDFRICLTGPTTMGALLNSLQMGFRTLAIQKRSNEVWKVLSAVKTEFDTFADVLTKTQEKIDQANKELDKLVGVRTRQIQKKLGDVQVLPISVMQLLTEFGSLNASIIFLPTLLTTIISTSVGIILGKVF